MRTREEILARMAEIDAAPDLTDALMTEYEACEAELVTVNRADGIRARNRAYNMPAPGQAVPVAPPKVDNGLDKAFEAYLRTGQPNADIAGLAVKNEQGTGTGGAGGFTVPSTFRAKLVEVQKAFGGLATEVDSFSTGDGTAVEYPSLNDTANQGDITAENAAVADGDDLVFDTITLGAFTYTSAGTGSNLPLRVSWELLQDSAFDIAGLVARALGTRIARKEAVHWTQGTGTSQPLGIVGTGITADHALAVADTITYAELLAAEALLDPAYEQNAQWVMNKATWVGVRGIVDDDGRPLIQANAESGIGTRPVKTLMGYPVVIDQSMPTYTADGAKFAVLGDLRESYVIRRVSELAVVVNPWTRASFRQTEFTAWERADGNVQNRSAYVVLANHA